MYQQEIATPEGDSLIDALYQRYAATMFSYVRQHASSREDAEDIVVETFLAALEDARFAQLNEKSQVAWLWRVARNKIIDSYRRASVRRSVPLDEMSEFLFDDAMLAPEEIALRSEEEEQVKSLLRSLPSSHQEVMHLRFVHGLRCAEIATIVGKREAAVRVTLSRAMNLLRNIYSNGRGR